MNIQEQESQRIVIALGIFASVAATIAILSGKDSITSIIKLTLAISGFWSFLYILTTAANMKYLGPGTIGDFAFTKKFRQRCFDFSVDTYGFNFILIVGYIISSLWLHNNFLLGLIGSLCLAFVLLLAGEFLTTKENQR